MRRWTERGARRREVARAAEVIVWASACERSDDESRVIGERGGALIATGRG